MSEATLPPLAVAIQHLKAAVGSGIRGNNLRAVQAALEHLTADRGGDLTDLHYRALRPGDRLFDRKRRGLIAMCGKAGTTWVYRTRMPGKARQTEVRFGRYPELGLADARATWERLVAQRRRGEIPTLQAEAASLTVAQLVEKYLTEYAARAKRPRSIAEDRRLLERHVLPNFGKILATDYGHAAATATLRPLKDRGKMREAQKVRAVVSKMFEVAARGGGTRADLGDVRWLPPTMPNPMRGVDAPVESGETYLPERDELRRYWAALGRRAGEVAADAASVQALTGCRIEEVVSMRAGELDLERGLWTLPKARSKNRREHRIWFSAPALAIVRQRIAAGRSAGADVVFPAPKDRSRPILQANVHRLVASVREDAGLHPTFRTHSLRAALLTWVAENGGEKDIRDRLSNHVDRGAVDSRYTRATLDNAAIARWAGWADHLAALVSDNVVEIGASRV